MNTTAPSFDLAKLVERVKLVFTAPTTCWETIAAENASAKEITLRYVAPLAVIGAVCSFLGMQIFGIGTTLGTYRPGFMSNLISMIITPVLQIGSLFLVAAVIEKLAPQFSGATDFHRAFKLAAHAAIPGLLSGILGIIPMLMTLGLLFGLFGLYLLYVGTPKLVGVPDDKRIVFILATIVAVFVIWFVMASVVGMFTVGTTMPMPSS